MALTIHQAGIDAAINAQANGFAGVTLNRVELYNGSTRVATLPLEGVQVIEPGRVYVVAQDSSTATYDVQRIDFYTSTGVKFATAQNDDGSVIQSKAANTTLLLAHQLNIASAPGSVAPSGDVSVYAPQATESLLGTAEIATQGETDAGSDDTRFVTPKKLGQWLRNKLSSSVDSTSTTTPASVKGVKAAYDKAVSVLSSLNSHTGNKSNPHGVSKSQVGLGSVNNWGATSSTSDGSSSKYATAAGVKAAYASGTRQATESLRGQVELATDAETKGGTDKTRAVVPYYLKQWWESVRTWGNIKGKPSTFPPSSHTHSKSQVSGLGSAAGLNAGDRDGQVALIGSPASSGRTAVVVQSGSNGNGYYRIWSDGYKEQWGIHEGGGSEPLKINFPTPFTNENSVSVLISIHNINYSVMQSDDRLDIYAISKSSFDVVRPGTASHIHGFFWRACGV